MSLCLQLKFTEIDGDDDHQKALKLSCYAVLLNAMCRVSNTLNIKGGRLGSLAIIGT